MDTASRQKELFFNNLLILGLDKTAIEKEYRVICDKNMFCLPNQKMFEVITYFLFSKLNEVTRTKYLLPWPLLDKDQHRQFQKSCFNHLSAISMESNVKFPRIVSSLLSTFGGDRFYELYFSFSMHVVEKTITKNDNESLILMPTVSPQTSQDVLVMLKIATILSTEKFQEIQAFSREHFDLLLNLANTYISHIQNLKLSLASNCSLLKENTRNLTSLYSGAEDQDEKSLLKSTIKKVLEYEKKVKELWHPLNKFFAKDKRLWNCLCSEVEENCEKYVLNKEDLKFVVSDTIREYCPQLNEIADPKENESLSLIQYLKSFYILLEYYTRALKNDLSQVNELCFIEKNSSLEESLRLLKNFNEKLLTDVVPSIKDNTEKLEDSLFSKESSEDLEQIQCQESLPGNCVTIYNVFLKECPSWSCCSQSFQEKIYNSRSLTFSTMPLTEEATIASLLHSNDVLEDLKTASNESCVDLPQETSISQNILSPVDCLPATMLFKANTFLNEATIDIKNVNCTPRGNSDKFLTSFESDESYLEKPLIQDMLSCPGEINPVTSAPASISSLFQIDPDLELDHTRPRKYTLRESWQMEESLNAMTLPEISFSE